MVIPQDLGFHFIFSCFSSRLGATYDCHRLSVSCCHHLSVAFVSRRLGAAFVCHRRDTIFIV